MFGFERFIYIYSQRERKRERERLTDRQTDRQRQTTRQTERHTETETDRQRSVFRESCMHLIFMFSTTTTKHIPLAIAPCGQHLLILTLFCARHSCLCCSLHGHHGRSEVRACMLAHRSSEPEEECPHVMKSYMKMKSWEWIEEKGRE